MRAEEILVLKKSAIVCHSALFGCEEKTYVPQLIMAQNADENFPEAKGPVKESTTISEAYQVFNYDYIMAKYIGELGKYQFPFLIWLCLPVATSSIIIMCFSFTGAVPDYRYLAKNFIWIFQRFFLQSAAFLFFGRAK